MSLISPIQESLDIMLNYVSIPNKMPHETVNELIRVLYNERVRENWHSIRRLRYGLEEQLDAIKELGESGSVIAIDYLRKMIQKPHPYVRGELHKALSSKRTTDKRVFDYPSQSVSSLESTLSSLESTLHYATSIQSSPDRDKKVEQLIAVIDNEERFYIPQVEGKSQHSDVNIFESFLSWWLAYYPTALYINYGKYLISKYIKSEAIQLLGESESSKALHYLERLLETETKTVDAVYEDLGRAESTSYEVYNNAKGSIRGNIPDGTRAAIHQLKQALKILTIFEK